MELASFPLTPYDISRNHCVDDCLKHKSEWLLFIDSDVLVPANVFDLLAAKNLPVCLSGEAVVGGSNLEISELKPLDRVLSKSGKEQLILETYNREYSGKLIKVKVAGLLPVIMTPNHPVLIAKAVTKRGIHATKTCPKCGRKGSAYISKVKTEHLKYLCFRHHIHGRQKDCYIGSWRRLKITEWKRAEDLKERDYVVIPRIKVEKNVKIKFQKFTGGRPKIYDGKKIHHTQLSYITLDEDLARLFGLYVAEGFVDKDYHETHFSLHIKEKELAEYIKKVLKNKLDVNVYYRVIERDRSLVVNAMSTGLGHFLEVEFGRGARNKHTSPLIKRAPKPIVRAFIDGVIKGDGNIQVDGDIRITTSSKRLAYDLFELLMKLGIPAYIQIKPPTQTVIKGRETRGGESYNICLSGLHWAGKADKMGRKYRSMTFFDENYAYIPIKEVKAFHRTVKVHNLKTEDETFCVPFVVHNCSALYYRRHKPLHSAMWKLAPAGNIQCPTCNQLYYPRTKGKYNPITEYPRGRIIECDVIGMGAALIHRRVLEATHHPPEDPLFVWTAGREAQLKDHILKNIVDGKGTSEDFYACEKIKAAGFKIVCATDIICPHETTVKVVPPENMLVDDVKYGGFEFPNL